MSIITLPDCYPESASEANMQLGQKHRLELDDYKTLALLEASGKASYGHIASLIDHEEAAELVKKSGGEEAGHAHRIVKILKLLTGEDHQLPADADNPLIKPSPLTEVTPQLLQMMAQGEYAGEVNYNRWADNCGHDEVAKILRLIAADEKRHAERAERVLTLISQA